LAVDLTALLVALAGLALIVLIGYLVYTASFAAFEEVGFTRQQATLLLVGLFFLSFFDVPLPLPPQHGWILAINLGGGVLPIVMSIWLLTRRPTVLTEALAGILVVALVTYFTVTVTPDGIGAPFPIFLIPPLVAAGISLVAHWRSEEAAAPLAFVSGSIGSLLGADIFHLPDFLAQKPPSGTDNVVSIGGAGVFDMVVLAAVIAVGLDILFFHRIRHEFAPDQADVFTTSTPADEIRDWLPRSSGPVAPTVAAAAAITPVQQLRARPSSIQGRTVRDTRMPHEIAAAKTAAQAPPPGPRVGNP
jgi:uncharacterized membrane protein